MLNFVKVIAVVTKFKVKGVKPTIQRTAKTHPGMERGYLIAVSWLSSSVIRRSVCLIMDTLRD